MTVMCVNNVNKGIQEVTIFTIFRMGSYSWVESNQRKAHGWVSVLVALLFPLQEMFSIIRLLHWETLQLNLAGKARWLSVYFSRDSNSSCQISRLLEKKLAWSILVKFYKLLDSLSCLCSEFWCAIPIRLIWLCYVGLLWYSANFCSRSPRAVF